MQLLARKWRCPVLWPVWATTLHRDQRRWFQSSNLRPGWGLLGFQALHLSQVSFLSLGSQRLTTWKGPATLLPTIYSSGTRR